MARKILTIGITINLENYENLRLEVQGEVVDDRSSEEIISFLDGMLTRLGHGDEATAERVEAYRRRVLTMPGSGEAISGTVVREARQPPAAGRPAQAGASPEPEARPREPAPAGARQEAPPEREEKPAIVRVSPEARAAKPAARVPERKAGTPTGAGAPEVRKGPTPAPPQEAKKEAGPKPERPPLAEGEVACEGCGLAITKNQEKLSRLLTGKSLCKRCMNPP
jgi:hypothetical protein